MNYKSTKASEVPPRGAHVAGTRGWTRDGPHLSSVVSVRDHLFLQHRAAESDSISFEM